MTKNKVKLEHTKICIQSAYQCECSFLYHNVNVCSYEFQRKWRQNRIKCKQNKTTHCHCSINNLTPTLRCSTVYIFVCCFVYRNNTCRFHYDRRTNFNIFCWMQYSPTRFKENVLRKMKRNRSSSSTEIPTCLAVNTHIERPLVVIPFGVRRTF